MKSMVNEPGNRTTLKQREIQTMNLLRWFHQQKECQIPISGHILREKVKFFYEKIKISEIEMGDYIIFLNQLVPCLLNSLPSKR